MMARWLVRALARGLFPLRLPFSTAAPATDGGGYRGCASVKKVTVSNFAEALEGLRRVVRVSDFVAFDLEMTGVASTPWREAFEFDDAVVRYLKVKDSAEKFAVVQFGVCPFRWDHSKQAFVAQPHNFYIFPRSDHLLDGIAYEFLCQTASLDFLAKYHFDFNAWIHEGISYLSREQEMDAILKLSAKSEAELARSFYIEDNVKIPLSSTTDLLFTERMKNQFRKWREGILTSNYNGSKLDEEHNCHQPQLETFFYKMRPAVMLNGYSSHQINLIQMVIRKYYPDLVFVRMDNEEIQVVYTDSKEDKELLQEDVRKDHHQRNEIKVESAVAFRHVIELLVSEQKLIAGYNCFLDIAHIYSKFIGRLPPTISEFAVSFHKLFPNVIDTKQLLDSNLTLQNLMKKNRKSLSSAFSLLCPEIANQEAHRSSSSSYVKVEVEADETGSSNWNSGSQHDAGYDAFMTGCIFAQACSHLGVNFGEQESSSSPLDLPGNNRRLSNHLNIVFPSFASGSFVDLGTGTENPDPNYKRRFPAVVFSDVVVLWGFSPELKPKDLKEIISKAFGKEAVISVFFLDSTSALVQFRSERICREFRALKEFLEGREDPISVLHPLSALLEGGKTRAGGYEVYREVCAERGSKIVFADQAEELGLLWKKKKLGFRCEAKEPLDDGEEGGGGGGEPRMPRTISCQEILDSLRAAHRVH